MNPRANHSFACFSIHNQTKKMLKAGSRRPKIPLENWPSLRNPTHERPLIL
jgi:hypothetical protein